MSCNAVVPKRIFAVLITLAFLTGTYAAAQGTVQPVNEFYIGYSWLHPNGNVSWGKVRYRAGAMPASRTIYRRPITWALLWTAASIPAEAPATTMGSAQMWG